MKKETIVDIFQTYLNLDTNAAEELYELSEVFLDAYFYKVPLGQLEDYIDIVEQDDFFDRFGTIQEYRKFRESCVLTKVFELDNGVIVIFNDVIV